jgi:hypothetical protein
VIWTCQEENEFLFLHVGKTGGSPIFCNFVLPRLEEFKSDVNLWCRNMKPATAEEMTIPPVYYQKYGKKLHMTKMDDDIDTVAQYNVLLSLFKIQPLILFLPKIMKKAVKN